MLSPRLHLFNVCLRYTQFLSIDQRQHNDFNCIEPGIVAVRDCRGERFFRDGDIRG